jgi:hemolysin III
MENNMIQPSDFGPIYAETLFGRFPVEPWNTFSNLIFILVFIHFFQKIQQQPRRYPITFVSLMILLVGFIGGTIYHATRSHNIWLFLDFMPIGVLVLLGTLFFWRKLTGSLWKALLLLILTLGASRLLSYLLITERHVRISFGYIMMAVVILLPAFLLSRKLSWKGRCSLIKAVVSFSGAVLCRIGDASWGKVLPMGTHFIWHILGGIATYYLFSFLLMVEVACDGEEGNLA